MPVAGEVRLKEDGAIAVVELNHPGKYNAMSRAMWRELAEVFRAIQADALNSSRWRCVLLRGAEGPRGIFARAATSPSTRRFASTASVCAPFTKTRYGAACRP